MSEMRDTYGRPINPVSSPQGWECPKCRAVYAPFMPMCTRCSNPPARLASPATSPR